MLVSLTISAMLVVGLARGPWWGWLIGGAALAFLSLSDPRYTRPSLADAHLPEALSLLRSDLLCVSACGLLAAMAFAAGRMMSWALPV